MGAALLARRLVLVSFSCALLAVAADSCWAQQIARRSSTTPAGRTIPRQDGYIDKPSVYTEENFIRWAREAAPKRMTPGQLDAETGLLSWPRALLRSDFADLRRPLDRMFAERADTGGAVTTESFDDMLAHIEQMTARLVANIRRYRGPNGANDYMEARNFLRSMAYEVGFAPEGDAVAQDSGSSTKSASSAGRASGSRRQ
jgi:hypothetical protein